MTERSKPKYVLGIDTSNYTTSVAVTDDDHNIICDKRRLLKVKQGERGLRQSDALFQHIKNLPELIKAAFEESKEGKFFAVSCSVCPRPVEGSYMPVFMASQSFARSIACALDVPCFEFSHQEGHIEAVKRFADPDKEKRFLACHFSGGTCEILSVSEKDDKGYDIEIVGGSKDISFGQVIDRTGVFMGINFPCGKTMDDMAFDIEEDSISKKVLTPVKAENGWINLSGIETQIKNNIKNFENRDILIWEIFEKISDAICKMIKQCMQKTGLNKIILAGGVASSRFLKRSITHDERLYGAELFFDEHGLSTDNAVGISLLGGKKIWP